jgi:hypothetical protein
MEYEEVLTVHVVIEKTSELRNSDYDSVVMISFTGTVTGKYFEGIVLDGGVDTQIIEKFGDRHSLSARYMLQGIDFTGQTCKIYIENNGVINQKLEVGLFHTSPKMITDSKALSFLHGDILIGEGHSTESGVDITIFRATS